MLRGGDTARLAANPAVAISPFRLLVKSAVDIGLVEVLIAATFIIGTPEFVETPIIDDFSHYRGDVHRTRCDDLHEDMHSRTSDYRRDERYCNHGNSLPGVDLRRGDKYRKYREHLHTDQNFDNFRFLSGRERELLIAPTNFTESLPNDGLHGGVGDYYTAKTAGG